MESCHLCVCSFKIIVLPSCENVDLFLVLLGLLMHTFVVNDAINRSSFETNILHHVGSILFIYPCS